jgi:hypothetical protein
MSFPKRCRRMRLLSFLTLDGLEVATLKQVREFMQSKGRADHQ